MLANTLLIFVLQILAVSASTKIPRPKLRTFNWNIGWVNAAPDGFERPFVAINGQWPCPALDLNVGDTIKINAYNGLGNESTAIHFHGIFQHNTAEMDGPAMVTQCPIAPGMTFVYEFTVTQTGTYWYHAHIGGQYIDGFRGPIIVHDYNAPFVYDEEIVLTLSDLYHDQAPSLINYYQSPDNENTYGGTEPVPDSILINEAQNVHFTIIPGRTYLFRIVNMGAMTSQWLQFDQHLMMVVEVDGVYIQPYYTEQLFMTVAQRYSIIVTALPTASENFAIVSAMMTDMFDQSKYPAGMETTVTGWLVYDNTKPLPPPFSLVPQPFDDTAMFPLDNQPLIGPTGSLDNQTTMEVAFGSNGQNQVRGQFNGQDYITQQVPTLYTLMNAPAADVENPAIYGTVNPMIFELGDIVEIFIDNHDFNNHPFHLHGHNFQVVDRSSGGANFPGISSAYPTAPMRRDTIMVYGGGYAVIRFQVTSPGVNLFHCHIEWHVEAGLTATFIEAAPQLQAQKLYLPDSHRDACNKQKILMKGNAAGNYKNYLDLMGANVEPKLENWGALINPPS